MKEPRTPGDLYNELVMSRADGAGSLMLVEGEDDHRFWTRRVAREKCDLVIGGGRPNVEACIRLADRRRFRGALGVVDADFSCIDGNPTSPNLIHTEDHDLEAMLLQSSAFDAVLVEHGIRARIAAFEARECRAVRDALLARGLHFGRLRWLSQRRTVRLDFEALKPARFVDKAGWRLDVDALYLTAATLAGLAVDELHAHLADLPEAPAWALCQGHDLLHILNFGLASALGDRSPGHDALGRSLRLAFQHSELHTSRLYRDIRAWESRNSPYLILPPPSATAS